MKKIVNLFLIIIIIIVLPFFFVKVLPNSINISSVGLLKIEIIASPVKKDNSNIYIITDKNEMKEYVDIINNIKVKKTNDSFQESPNMSINIYYDNGGIVCLQFNHFGQQYKTLLSITDNQMYSKNKNLFFYTDELYKLTPTKE